MSLRNRDIILNYGENGKCQKTGFFHGGSGKHNRI